VERETNRSSCVCGSHVPGVARRTAATPRRWSIKQAPLFSPVNRRAPQCRSHTSYRWLARSLIIVRSSVALRRRAGALARVVDRPGIMAGGGEAVPLLGTKRRREGCPGCRLEEANKTSTGVPYLNFFYIWIVCLTSSEYA
jgi:hypothetical protein